MWMDSKSLDTLWWYDEVYVIIMVWCINNVTLQYFIIRTGKYEYRFLGFCSVLHRRTNPYQWQTHRNPWIRPLLDLAQTEDKHTRQNTLQMIEGTSAERIKNGWRLSRTEPGARTCAGGKLIWWSTRSGPHVYFDGTTLEAIAHICTSGNETHAHVESDREIFLLLRTHGSFSIFLFLLLLLISITRLRCAL